MHLLCRYVVAAVVAIVPASLGTTVGAHASADCGPARATAVETASLGKTLVAGRDVLGEKLLASNEGPTYEGVRRLVTPIRYARGRGGSSPTTSGVYYVVFAYPLSLYGDKAFALHVADGSEIVTRRTTGPRLSVFVGGGRERYGSCEGRLGGPRLVGGYQPILETTYVDAAGVRYRQESFAGRVRGVPSLVSWVRLSVDARAAARPALVRLVASTGSRHRLVTDGRGTTDGVEVRYRVRGRAVIHAAWVHSPVTGVVADADAYDSSRRDVVGLWRRELAGGATFVVPEERVMNAQRHLLIQQRILTWRYSIGNNYEELSFAEALDAAQVMAAYGHGDVSRAILRFALKRLPHRYTNWRAGAVLRAAASHVALTDDHRFVNEQAAALAAALGRLAQQIHRPGGTGLLDREAFSSDIARKVAALHGQTVAWAGLTAMGHVWATSGRERLAARANHAARRLGTALRLAVRASQHRLVDDSVFVPAALLDGARPFDRVAASREGSYWNLVMPYALASGLFSPSGSVAHGVWRYMQRHGSMLLGLIRADAARLYRGVPYPSTGIDQVYGLNLARYEADLDVPDQLVLTLYGTLGGAMTPETFVSGEAVSVAPLQGLRQRAMYLPPNGGANTTFLETLRLMLVHERRNGLSAPVGLDLAFSTPRGWLRPGATIAVQRAPTSFGPVSYTIARRGNVVDVTVDAPPTPDLRLRLRLPNGRRILRVDARGTTLAVDASGAVRLPHDGEPIALVARLRRP